MRITESDTIQILKSVVNGEFNDFKKQVNDYLENKIQNSKQFQEIKAREEELKSLNQTFKKIQET